MISYTPRVLTAHFRIKFDLYEEKVGDHPDVADDFTHPGELRALYELMRPNIVSRKVDPTRECPFPYFRNNLHSQEADVDSDGDASVTEAEEIVEVTKHFNVHKGAAEMIFSDSSTRLTQPT